ncbi:MAG: IS91 family transposase [Fluviicola sp.]|nr:MAG: IS91 family transposase [Fluviicola sp.]
MSSLSMAEVLSQFGNAYADQYPYRPEQQQVVTCIRQCRTPALGYTQIYCNECKKETIQYHSCRNRHCPKCQRQASLEWREKRQRDLLPVSYFHLVFTLPHTLNGWVRLHPRELYRSLFHAAWKTLKQFAKNPKGLDGELGATVVLHTWGQKLDQHVHLHVLVPAGAWSKEKKQWHPARSTYLFPVKALSRKFRGVMVSSLRESYQRGELSCITRKNEVNEILNIVMQEKWNVYTKACHGKPERVLDYLSRYTYRIAISESRIIDANGDGVRFRWKDYRDGKQKLLRLSGVEFIRRFLQHVLPKGFMRIRHYGFLSNRYRRSKLADINEALNVSLKNEGQGKVTIVKEPSDMLPESRQIWFCCHCRSKDTYIVRQVDRFREYPRMK